MAIDFTLLDQYLVTAAAPNDDVSYLRYHVKQFITLVDAKEQLQTQQVIPLPFGTWNATFLLQPANLVLKLSPWSDQFEADFLSMAAALAVRLPRYITYGAIPDPRLPNASYLLMEYIGNSTTAGPLLAQGVLTEAELIAIGTELGTLLANLHTLHFPHLRHFDNTTLDWGAGLALWDLTETALFDQSLLTHFRQLLEQSNYRQQTQGTLIHSDANLHNILIDPQNHIFQALIDPGPMIIGLPMYDLAYAVQPWNYGQVYQQAVINAYCAAGGIFEAQFFNLSLLCVAYQLSHYQQQNIANTRAWIYSNILHETLPTAEA